MTEIETVHVELPERGWWADLDADPPLGFGSALLSDRLDTLAEALVPLVVDWHVTDREGEELPPTAEGMARVSMRGLRALVQAYVAAFTALPNEPSSSSSRTSTTAHARSRSGRAPAPRSST